ncbi:MAG: DNA/RNA non-specific endonuclease [Eubacteriales bacterium]|nr:DNA/RNA non-specific endonuclease [Eubacteriales bacterium]
MRFRNLKVVWALWGLAICSTLLLGCGEPEAADEPVSSVNYAAAAEEVSEEPASENEETTESVSTAHSAEMYEESSAASVETDMDAAGQTEASEAEVIPAEAQAPSEIVYAAEFEYTAVPEYSDQPYVIVNDNKPFFSDKEYMTTSFELYSELDELGRCGAAYANIGQDIMPTEERGEIGMIRPSGWHTVKYSDLIEDRFLYNRCHLIGYQLSGENANEKNLITGTRYLNVTGMLPFENEIADYVQRTDHHVLYRVTPVFVDSELVARGVLMEAGSVEDDALAFCVFCYNVQPHIWIDYATGDSAPADEGSVSGEKGDDEEQTREAGREEGNNGEQTQETDREEGGDAGPDVSANAAEEAEPEQLTEVTRAQDPETVRETPAASYIGNWNTEVFHYTDCGSVKKMSEKNKYYFEGTRDEIMAQGFRPCQNCNP